MMENRRVCSHCAAGNNTSTERCHPQSASYTYTHELEEPSMSENVYCVIRKVSSRKFWSRVVTEINQHCRTDESEQWLVAGKSSTVTLRCAVSPSQVVSFSWNAVPLTLVLVVKVQCSCWGDSNTLASSIMLIKPCTGKRANIVG